MVSKTTILCLATAILTSIASIGAVDSDALAKARETLGKMTLEEKVSLCAGSGTTTLPAVPNAGIDAEFQISGNTRTIHPDLERWTWNKVNAASTNTVATVLPSLSALASTWSTDLAEMFGHILGEEARARGKDVLLGPNLNLMRSPLCGRNWERFSEDPLLTARMANAEIRAIQSHDVAACAKYLGLSTQEDDRDSNNSIVSDRALNEIYLAPFRSAVKDGGVMGIMVSRDMLNGQRCTENPFLLKGMLRGWWGFDGMLLSDWGSVRNTVGVALAGAGTEMNRGVDIKHFVNPKEGTYPLEDEVNAGRVPEEAVDEKALRILYTMYRTKFIGGAGRDKGEILTEKHQKGAQRIAEEAITLLKNDSGTLPLNAKETKKILILGRLADTEMTRKGWGEEGNPPYEITPYKGIVEYFKDDAEVEIERMPLVVSDGADFVHPIAEGYIGTFDSAAKDKHRVISAWETEWFDNTKVPQEVPTRKGYSREPKLDLGEKAPFEDMNRNAFVVRWSTKLTAPETGDFVFSCEMDRLGGALMVLDGEVLASGTAMGRVSGQRWLEEGKEYYFSVAYLGDTGEHSMTFGWRLPSESRKTSELKEKAENADAVLVFTGTEVGHGRAMECEGADRPNLKLPEGHDDVISEILGWGLKNVVVINHSGSPMEFPWVDKCKTLIQQPYIGQEAGRALARVLFGDVNPSGKLPCTWPKNYEDTPTAVEGAVTPFLSLYKEGTDIGYRWYDRKKITPMFPFGHGLSYTKFDFEMEKADILKLSDDKGWTVSVPVKNIGSVAGKETVQIYVSYPGAKVERCVKELKGFAKTRLIAPNESQKVEVTISPRDLAYWDTFETRFRLDAGEYEVIVGASAMDIRGRAKINVAKDYVFAD